MARLSDSLLPLALQRQVNLLWRDRRIFDAGRRRHPRWHLLSSRTSTDCTDGRQEAIFLGSAIKSRTFSTEVGTLKLSSIIIGKL